MIPPVPRSTDLAGHSMGDPHSEAAAVNPPLVYPFRRLPPGYADAIRFHPITPITPRPAATLVLLRRNPHGMELLLLKRSSGARFIPEAWVFPGGRVDSADGPGDPGTFPVTALRETFEEAGVLCLPRGAALSFSGEGNAEGSFLRKRLHAGEISFPAVLKALQVAVAPGELTPIGHWMTPVQEAHRYDTRFFGVEVPEDCSAFPDGAELLDAVWLPPKAALRRNLEGRLPMVFPTILTLEALSAFSDPGEALRILGNERIIRPRLPVVEEREDGIAMAVGDGS